MKNDKKKIIVADDDDSTLALLEDFLDSENFEVYPVLNGIQLFEILKAQDIDLILLDIMMNWISGYDLCKALKQSDEYKDIPIIFISARASSEDIEMGFKSGCDDYCTKPFELNNLLDKINRFIK